MQILVVRGGGGAPHKVSSTMLRKLARDECIVSEKIHTCLQRKFLRSAGGMEKSNSDESKLY